MSRTHTARDHQKENDMNETPEREELDVEGHKAKHLAADTGIDQPDVEGHRMRHDA